MKGAAAAGFLNGKRATTNSSAYDFLTPYCAEVISARVVRDGNTVTGAGLRLPLTWDYTWSKW